MFIFDYTNTNKFESRSEQFLDFLLETDIQMAMCLSNFSIDLLYLVAVRTCPFHVRVPRFQNIPENVPGFFHWICIIL